MDQVRAFLNSFPHGERAKWARDHGMDPIRVAQIAGGHKGCGLDYAHKIIQASGGKLVLEHFVMSTVPNQPTPEKAAA